MYCLDDSDIGHNERLIAKGIKRFAGGRSVVVATKGGCTRPKGRWAVDGRPEHIKAACERSLKALGVEQIALYQLHTVDDRIRLEDTVGALAELRVEGKMANVGLSNVTVDQIKRAELIVPIVSVQNRMNPYDVRAFRDGVLKYCQEQGIAFLPYSPVGGSRGISKLKADPVLSAIGARHRDHGPAGGDRLVVGEVAGDRGDPRRLAAGERDREREGEGHRARPEGRGRARRHVPR